MADQTDRIGQLERRLRVIEDREQLGALLNRYCYIADARDWKSYSETFTEDGSMHYESWPEVRGREAIAKAASAENIFEGLQHSMTNFQFEVDGSDRATGRSYLWFAATPRTANPADNYSFGGPYHFDFVRTSEGWRISRMRLKKIWAHGQDSLGVFG
ncbi:uncharacterized protein A1O9_12301 [Exophiala aquamarina CBS 119918]|uniref:SnoaL-like domain-containing protein n=1 Tax=Exophiala aquamarina CBS 119918 TaxID=1182545 RepID=A0A072NVN9_9EURO|nr:uncharacterized protein A1O9_12301 [Exophiala aquamarina CBS 119918]KEF51666.1 hypothetical protein A1O9_12301 [Exophiala aquamarina CBS 119918]